MQNDSDEKYDINEDDSEYHFSDDDMGYESEDAEPEVVTPKVPVEKKKMPTVSKLSSSKRILITLGVFFVLVLIFYKMVASTGNEAPSTNISSREPVSVPPLKQNVLADKSVSDQKVVDQPIAVVSPTSVTATDKQTISSAAPTQLSATTPSITSEAELNTLSQQKGQDSLQMPMSASSSAPSAPLATQNVAPIQRVTPAAAVSAPAPTTNTIPVTSAMPAESSAITQTPTTLPIETTPNAAMPTTQPTTPAAANTMPSSTMPSSGATPMVQQSTSSLGTPGVENAVMSNNQVEAMTRAVAVENEKMVSQMQANYTERLSDYDYQNKALQTQVQSLNERVMTLESQLNQLVQALTRNAGAGGSTESRQETPPPAQEDNSPRIGYNVQAIIPGRAWLRSDDGETITVAEGDLLKGVGRVTKIDPYNGVVEINTGNRVISLAYGGGS